MLIAKLSVKKVIVLVITAGLLFGGYFYFFESQTPTTQTVKSQTQVARGAIQKKIKVLGNAQFADEQTMRFNQLGKVETVFFEAGAEVQKDQIIAELDKTDIINNIQQMEIRLENTKIKLEDLYSGNTDAAILKAHNDVKDTELAIAQAQVENSNLEQEKVEKLQLLQYGINEKKQTLDNATANRVSNNAELDRELALAIKDVQDKQQALTNVRQELDNVNIFEKQNMSTAKTNYSKETEAAFLFIENVFIDTDNVLSNINSFLAEDEPVKYLKDDALYNFLGAKSPQSVVDAVDSYTRVKDKRDQVKSQYNHMQQSGIITKDELLQVLSETEVLLSTLLEATNDMYVVLEKTLTYAELSNAELEAYKRSVASDRSAMQARLVSLQSNIASIKNLEGTELTELRSGDTIAKKEEELRSSEYNLTKSENSVQSLQATMPTKKEDNDLTVMRAKNDYDNAIVEKGTSERSYDLQLQTKRDQLFSLQQNFQQQKENLKDIVDGASDEDIAIAQNDIKLQELALEQAKEDMDKYELIAPFDGVVRQIDYKVGDNLLEDEDKFVYLVNPYVLEVSVLLDQVEIVGVKQGQTALITFDAFPNQSFQGTLTTIYQTPTQQSGVVSYEALVTLNIEDIVRQMEQTAIREESVNSASGVGIRAQNKLIFGAGSGLLASDVVSVSANPIFSGMTANVEIIIEEKRDVLVIANVAISEQSGEKTVLVLKDGQEVLTPIRLGMTDGISSEVLSGLTEGDMVILPGFNASVSAGNGAGTNSQDPTQAFMRATRSGGGGGVGGAAAGGAAAGGR